MPAQFWPISSAKALNRRLQGFAVSFAQFVVQLEAVLFFVFRQNVFNLFEFSIGFFQQTLCLWLRSADGTNQRFFWAFHIGLKSLKSVWL